MLCQNNKKEAEDIKLNNETTYPTLLIGLMIPNQRNYNIFIGITLIFAQRIIYFNPVLNNNMMRSLCSPGERASSIMFSYIYMSYSLFIPDITYLYMYTTCKWIWN